MDLMEWLHDIDTAVFFFFNKMGSPLLDDIMWYASRTAVWVPLYAVLVGSIFYLRKKRGIAVLLYVLLSVAAADMTSGLLLKPTIERFRPSRNPEIMDDVRVVNGYRGGSYGFVSSHAANTFAIATCFFLAFAEKRRLFSWLFLWAGFVSFTRLYLGVHYPGDLLCGALLGVALAYLLFRVGKKIILPTP